MRENLNYLLGHHVVNKEVENVRNILSKFYENQNLDGLGLFLYGFIIGKGENLIAESVTNNSLMLNEQISFSFSETLNKQIESEIFQRKLYISSIINYPWNWNSWLNLTETIKEVGILRVIENILPDHYFKPFWLAHANLALFQNQTAFELYLKLLKIYPNNKYLKYQLAIVFHNMRHLDPAHDLLEFLHNEDPYLLTGMDTYSNILFLKNNRARLSYLAHHMLNIDKYSCETCFVIGNYYTLDANYEKAIVYFQRSLKLNPQYLDSWILIGHAYVELKDPTRAINAYRKAADLNNLEYRAWYSLGQAYELLKMPQYAFYYFQKACELRPDDSRMWTAMADCYNANQKYHHASLCLKRAQSTGDSEKVALHKLAQMYRLVGIKDKAAYYYKKNLDSQESFSNSEQVIEALHFLATYNKENKMYQEAYKYYSRLVDYDCPEADDSKAQIREMNKFF